MLPLPPCIDWSGPLLDTGACVLTALGSTIDAADPEARVEPRSRLLCAALGRLSSVTYEAVGGSRHIEAVEHAGAMLSLLTKIDDQIIDSPAFHGGFASVRDDLPHRTRAYLDPTLQSIRDARPVNNEPRCALAAELGTALRALAADARRLDRVFDAIAAGWDVQVEAVRILSSHPKAVTRAEVERITRQISGAWLLMIALVGTLPSDTHRVLSPAEEEAFFDWGWAIQRADALADLHKDLADGLVSSLPGWLAFARVGDAYLDAACRGDARAVYALVHAHDIDRACLTDADAIASLGASLADLGDVPSLLGWIYTMLARRYLEHPLRARGDEATYSAEALCSAP